MLELTSNIIVLVGLFLDLSGAVYVLVPDSEFVQETLGERDKIVRINACRSNLVEDGRITPSNRGFEDVQQIIGDYVESEQEVIAIDHTTSHEELDRTLNHGNEVQFEHAYHHAFKNTDTRFVWVEFEEDGRERMGTLNEIERWLFDAMERPYRKTGVGLLIAGFGLQIASTLIELVFIT